MLNIHYNLLQYGRTHNNHSYIHYILHIYGETVKLISIKKITLVQTAGYPGKNNLYVHTFNGVIAS